VRLYGAISHLACVSAPPAVGSAMADIFVSYSKADHALALKLSTFLEAEGWSVWWDKSLAPADLYRDEIMKQLAAARAVISIWTPNSVKSDWVRAEAGAAKAQGKLIPVKTPDVAYGDIPLPFGEMHTENVGSTDLVRAAVVAQLAKPTVEPSGWALLGKGFKYELLTWVGIVGGALTLFGNLDTALKLADWAHVLVENWKEWTHAFWVWAFGWLGIHVPPYWTPVLTFLLFGSLLTIGQAIQFRHTIKTQQIIDKYHGKSLLVLLVAVSTLIATSLLVLTGFVPFVNTATLASPLSIVPVTAFNLFARDRLHAVMAACLMVIFWVIISVNPIVSIGMSSENPSDNLAVAAAYFASAAMLLVLTLIILSAAPAKAVSRRLIFLALGLLLLVALNELSKLGLDVTAPKLQG
jgi:hypothetical protein